MRALACAVGEHAAQKFQYGLYFGNTRERAEVACIRGREFYLTIFARLMGGENTREFFFRDADEKVVLIVAHQVVVLRPVLLDELGFFNKRLDFGFSLNGFKPRGLAEHLLDFKRQRRLVPEIRSQAQF